MTPRMSNIGASIRKMFSGIGGDGDYYWDNTVLALRGESGTDALWNKNVLAMHMNSPDPNWSNVSLLMHMNLEGDLYWASNVLNMRMNGADNETTFTDDKGKVFTVSGTVVTKTATKRFGTASAYFNGSSYLWMASHSDFIFGTSDFTIEAWVYLTASVMYNPIFTKETTLDYFFGVMPDSSGGNLIFDADGVILVKDSKPLQLNTWVHVAVSRSSGRLYLFVNGKLVDSVNDTTNLTAPGETRIGRGRGTSTNYVTGYIDDLRVTKGVGRYTADYTPSQSELPTALASYTNFKDEKGKTATVYGNSVLSATNKKFGSQSAKFNGIGDYLSIATSTDFDFGTADFTVEAFFSMSALPSVDNDGARAAIIVARSGSSSGNNIFHVLVYGNRLLFASNNNAQNFSVDVPNGWLLDKWYHVAAVRSSGVFTLYLDGIALGSFAHTASISGTQPVLIGGRAYSSNYYWYMNGYIDEVRITKGVARYTKNFRVPTQQFPSTEVFLDECGHMPYISGAPILVTDQSKYGGQSSQYLAAEDAISFSHSSDFGFELNDFTVEGWVKTTSSGLVFDLRERPSGSGAFAIVGGYMAFWIRGSYLTGQTLVNTGSWVHLAWVRNKGTIRFYVNGKVDGEFYYPVSLGDDCPCRVGIDLAGANGYIGYLDELRISKTARYTGEFTPSKNPFLDPMNSPLILDETGKIVSVDSYSSFSSNAKFGASSLSFNGTTSYLEYAANTDFNFGTGDFTVEFWVRPTAFTNSYQTIFANGTSSFDTTSNAIVLYTTGLIGMVYDVPSTTNNNVIVTTTAVTLNLWSHVAFSCQDGTLRCFVNGLLNATAVSPISWNFSLNNTLIGRNKWDGASGYFQGQLDDLRVSKGVARYTATFPVPVRTVANYGRERTDPYYDQITLGLHMDGADLGVSFPEVTGRAMTVVGNAKTSVTKKKFGTTSLALDGAGDYLSTPYHKNINLPELQAWTIEAWVYLNAGGMYCLFSSRYSDANRWSIEFSPTGIIGFYHGTISHTQIVGSWFHFAETYNGSVRTVYINGQSIGTQTGNFSGMPSFTSGLACIGYTQRSGYEYYLNGYIDDFRITAACRYTGNFTPSDAAFPDKQTPRKVLLADQYYSNLVCGLHMNGTDGGTTFTEVKGKVVTVAGNVNTSSAKARFGATSAYFDGTGDYLSVAASNDFDFGTGDFTVEAWVYPLTRTDPHPVPFANCTNGAGDIGIIIRNNGSGELLYDGTYSAYPASSILNDMWSHVAIERYNGQLTLYVNGKVVVTVTRATAIGHNANPFYLGSLNSASTTHRFIGYVDDFRVTKGLARYKSTFTPLGAFPDVGINDIFWSSTVLAIPFDGDNNQTTFTDYKGKALSRGGSAVLSTAEKVFGKSSLYLPGSGSYVSAAVSTDFNFGTADFTVEAWIKMEPRVSSAAIIDYFKSGVGGWQLLVDQNGYPSWYETNPRLYPLTASKAVNDNQWHHIQFNRYGTELMCFIDGEICGQVTNTKDYIAGADMLAIGAQMSTRNATYDFIGYIDEVRITKGVARNRRSYKLPGLPMANF